jgi:hypothetical protein
MQTGTCHRGLAFLGRGPWPEVCPCCSSSVVSLFVHLKIKHFSRSPRRCATDSLSDLLQIFLACPSLLGAPNTFFTGARARSQRPWSYVLSIVDILAWRRRRNAHQVFRILTLHYKSAFVLLYLSLKPFTFIICCCYPIKHQARCLGIRAEFLDASHVNATRLSPLFIGRFYLQLIFLVLISVGGCVDPRAIVRPEGLSRWKIPMNYLLLTAA